ncbi:MAG: DNA-binding domain-containing protein, partial [Thermoanaerobaculia bacterium]
MTRSQAVARQRFGGVSTRRRRSDAGRSRLRPEILGKLRSLVLAAERPSMTAIQRRLAEFARAHGWRPPARATLYAALSRLEGSRHALTTLPPSVRAALYNLAPESTVPGHQLAFYCFNYGSLAAASFAAGLPWIDLHQAARARGWRP